MLACCVRGLQLVSVSVCSLMCLLPHKHQVAISLHITLLPCASNTLFPMLDLADCQVTYNVASMFCLVSTWVNLNLDHSLYNDCLWLSCVSEGSLSEAQ